MGLGATPEISTSSRRTRNHPLPLRGLTENHKYRAVGVERQRHHRAFARFLVNRDRFNPPRVGPPQFRLLSFNAECALKPFRFREGAGDKIDDRRRGPCGGCSEFARSRPRSYRRSPAAYPVRLEHPPGASPHHFAFAVRVFGEASPSQAPQTSAAMCCTSVSQFG